MKAEEGRDNKGFYMAVKTGVASGTVMKLEVLTTLLVISGLLLCAVVVGTGASPCTCGEICVNESGWWRPGSAFNAIETPIQAAIDNAADGDTICVNEGMYTENVVVNKRLALQGKGADVVTVNAALNTTPVFNVTVDYVNISGFTVTGTTGDRKAGIYLNGASHCNISDNNCTNNGNGIMLEYSSYNIIYANIACSNSNRGIFVLYSNNANTISSNTANSNARHGISLGHSSNNTLTSNTANSNNIDGIGLWNSSSSNTLTSNTASNNKGGIYLSSSSNNTLTNNIVSGNEDRGIQLIVSTSNTIANNNVSDNGIGMSLYVFSDNNTILSNVISSNYYHGLIITVDGGKYNQLSSNIMQYNGKNDSANYPALVIADDYTSIGKNEILHNDGTGIYIGSSNNYISDSTSSYNNHGISLAPGSSNNTVTNNTASKNKWGIYLSSSSNNTLTNNIVSGNEDHGIHLKSSTNNTIANNNLSDNEVGMSLFVFSDNNTILSNVISSSYYHGLIIIVDGGKYNQLSSNIMQYNGKNYSGNYPAVGIADDYTSIGENQILHNNGTGIYIGSSHNCISDSTSSYNKQGISLSSRSSNNTVTNITCSHNGYGISLSPSSNNTFTNITVLDNSYYDFYSSGTSHGNNIEDFRMNSTTISFIYAHGIRIQTLTTPEPDPEGKVNIGKYVDVRNETGDSWILLDVCYGDADVTNVEESSLRLYHWSGTNWEEIAGSKVDTTKNYIYANVTSFSQIAAFGDPKRQK